MQVYLYSHGGVGSREEVVGSVDQVLQDAVGQVLLVHLIGHRQAGLCHHPACQQGQGLRLQRLCATCTKTLENLQPYAVRDQGASRTQWQIVRACKLGD